MAKADSFPVGQAPWEQSGSKDPHPDSFPVGSAPWESDSNSGGVLDKISKVGKAIDSVTGAPTRAAISAAQNQQNPITAFGKQFAQNPDNAPTGKDIVMKAGVPDTTYNVPSSQTPDQAQKFNAQFNPGLAQSLKQIGKTGAEPMRVNPADVAGFGMDLAADPINFLPAGKIAKGVERGAEALSKVSEAFPNKLRALAESSAVNATGATGKQAANFADNAGRELLDRGIVKLGDSQAKISERASQAVNEANKQIDDALTKLQANGVKVDRNDIYNKVQNTIDKMKVNESQADVAKNLDSELQNVVAAAEKGGAQAGVKDAELIKRGYKRKAGNWADPEKGMAGKEMYQAYRGAVEDAARAADPETAKLFEDGKASYGLLDPIQEAAERRAATTGQHQPGGFLDVASSVASHASGDPTGLVLPVARRVVSPRIASSVAVAADKAADVLDKIPNIAKIKIDHPEAYQAIVNLVSKSNNDLPALRAADNNAPTKGPDKWANDGVDKLIEHTDDPKLQKKLSDQKSSMLSDPKLKQLLISASDLKPGSKAMDQIMNKIINRSPNGGK